jgi:hypothetical protein
METGRKREKHNKQRAAEKDNKKRTIHKVWSFGLLRSLSALNFAGSQASGAYMHLFVRAVYFNGDSLNIRIPDSVGSSMRMADVVAEMSALATDITFSHLNTS